MISLWRFLVNMVKIIFGVDEKKRYKKAAKKEVKHEKKTSGDSGVAKSTSDWFRRNR